jgi:uncharacterized membrane protein
VSDHRHVARVLEGVSEWRPLGRHGPGVGARYSVRLGMLAVPIQARLVIVEWDRPRAIGWATESGLVVNRGRWTFRPATHGTRVGLAITYEPPAGAIGNFVAGRIESTVTARIIRALDRMKAELERG